MGPQIGLRASFVGFTRPACAGGISFTRPVRAVAISFYALCLCSWHQLLYVLLVRATSAFMRPARAVDISFYASCL